MDPIFTTILPFYTLFNKHNHIHIVSSRTTKHNVMYRRIVFFLVYLSMFISLPFNPYPAKLKLLKITETDVHWLDDRS